MENWLGVLELLAMRTGCPVEIPTNLDQMRVLVVRRIGQMLMVLPVKLMATNLERMVVLVMKADRMPKAWAAKDGQMVKMLAGSRADQRQTVLVGLRADQKPMFAFVMRVVQTLTGLQMR
jgi:hypothetical protein